MNESKLKEAIAENKVVIGSKSIVKHMKTGGFKMVFVAKNCPESIKKDLKHYAQLSDVKIEEFEGTGKQLGTFCGKPFSIATVAIKK